MKARAGWWVGTALGAAVIAAMAWRPAAKAPQPPPAAPFEERCPFTVSLDNGFVFRLGTGAIVFRPGGAEQTVEENDFYNDRLVSDCDPASGLPIRLVREYRRVLKRTDVEVTFDHGAGEARVVKQESGKPEPSHRTFKLPPPMHDPLTLVRLLRERPPAGRLDFSFHDGRKPYTGFVERTPGTADVYRCTLARVDVKPGQTREPLELEIEIGPAPGREIRRIATDSDAGRLVWERAGP